MIPGSVWSHSRQEMLKISLYAFRDATIMSLQPVKDCSGFCHPYCCMTMAMLNKIFTLSVKVSFSCLDFCVCCFFVLSLQVVIYILNLLQWSRWSHDISTCPFDGILLKSKASLQLHLKNWHQCDLLRNCGKDWAVGNYLESPLNVHCSHEPLEANAAVSAHDLTGVNAWVYPHLGVHY